MHMPGGISEAQEKCGRQELGDEEVAENLFAIRKKPSDLILRKGHGALVQSCELVVATIFPVMEQSAYKPSQMIAFHKELPKAASSRRNPKTGGTD